MLSLKNFVPYCGRQMKALYENRWHTGNINYYNDNTQIYHVLYDYDTEDYIGENGGNMGSMIIILKKSY